MRCLHCGKHLPLFRKLRGGGEFCSDAHRDKYHEEYNHLAVSRLLQAQARSEDVKPAKPAEPSPVAVAVATENAAPEMLESEVLPGSYIDEFRYREMTPVVAREKPPSLEVTPLPLRTPELCHPSIQRLAVVAACKAGFAGVLPDARQIATVPLNGGPVEARAFERAFPVLPDDSGGVRGLKDAGPVAFEVRSRRTRLELLALNAGLMEPTKPKLLMPANSLPPHVGFFSKPGSVPITMPFIETGDDGGLESGPVEQYPYLMEMQPFHNLELELLGFEQLTTDASPDAAPAGSKLHVDSIMAEPQEPPLSRTLKHINISPVAPAAAALAAGFDAVALPARARLLRYNTQPLRPRMAIGGASIPVIRRTNSNSLPDASKLMPRSMLHLDEELQADSDISAENPTLLGKLGGLFGKKSKGS